MPVTVIKEAADSILPIFACIGLRCRHARLPIRNVTVIQNKS
jgi:hypothetical protein